jgi:hypothetical protein
MPRFSILHLLAVTALAAVGCVALLNSSSIGAASLNGFVVLILAASVLLAVFRDRERRAYWVGFAFSGWLYLILCFGPIFYESPFGRSRIITGRLATALYDRIYARPDVPTYPADPFSVTDPFGPSSMAISPERADFLFVAHALWSVLFAMLGGLFARWLYESRKKLTDL